MVAAAARLDDGARPACVMGVDCGARETASRMGCYDARVGCVRACVCVCVSVPVSVLRCPSRPRSERMRTCANRCPPGVGGVGRSFPTRTGGGPHHHAHRVCVQRESGRCESVSVAFSVFARGLEKTEERPPRSPRHMRMHPPFQPLSRPRLAFVHSPIVSPHTPRPSCLATFFTPINASKIALWPP